MKDQGEDNRGTGKKFLYTGAKPKDSHPSQAWDTFAPKKKPHSDFDLDDVWSIKRNVTIGNPATSSTLNKTATTGTNTNSYYSRHSNVKFGDDINSSLGVSSGLSGPSGNTPSWTHSSRSNYSYADTGKSYKTEDQDNFMTSPQPHTSSTQPNRSNISSNRMMQAGGAPGTFRTGGRTQKSNRTTGSSWMDF